MSAWANKVDAITTRAERAMRNAIHAWSIETHKRVNACGPTSLRKKMTNTAQVSFALFAHCSNEQNGTVDRDSFVLNCLGQCDQGRQAAAVVCDSGCKKSAVALDDVEIGVL